MRLTGRGRSQRSPSEARTGEIVNEALRVAIRVRSPGAGIPTRDLEMSMPWATLGAREGSAMSADEKPREQITGHTTSMTGSTETWDAMTTRLIADADRRDRRDQAA